MKVLYAIQGTGNGHLSRARDVIPALQKHNIELDILVSGTQADITLNHPIKYQLKGLSFIFGKKGGVNMLRTYLKANASRLQHEIKNVPVQNYDLVINDFEPVSAWACKTRNSNCISFSHQAAVLSTNAPKPKKKDLLGKTILKNYAPTNKQYGLHFKEYDANVFTPIIRQDIRQLQSVSGNHYTVYLPAYSDAKLFKVLHQIKGVKWHVFSKHNTMPFVKDNVSIMPITNAVFIESLAGSKGVLCGAGFEAPAEALFLNKKLMVIPMKGQYEQQCNSVALKEMGVPIIKSLKPKHLPKIQNWVDSAAKVEVDYPDITDRIVDQILQEVML